MAIEYPVFVCECCGKIVRAIAYEDGDIYHCPFCDTVMTRTEYSIYDSEYEMFFGHNREAEQFSDSVFQEYVKNSSKYDADKLSERLLEDIRKLQEYMMMKDGRIK
ncbi:MAG: hypothetical protein IJ416_08870 [Ruminiclostridium sp.]|nr:hypothetical protein [Ruminiclostridium sp.]